MRGDEARAIVALVAADEAAAAAQAAQEAAEAAQRTAQAQVSVTAPQAVSGAHSDAWWHGVAICEQSGLNSPFFGYFSIMDGSAGGLPWDTQVAMANGIISRYGDGAWAASCVAAGYAASPGG